MPSEQLPKLWACTLLWPVSQCIRSCALPVKNCTIVHKHRESCIRRVVSLAQILLCLLASALEVLQEYHLTCASRVTDLLFDFTFCRDTCGWMALHSESQSTEADSRWQQVPYFRSHVRL